MLGELALLPRGAHLAAHARVSADCEDQQGLP